MNRIILVGNGFDLAHGLSTSYKNFMEWYWDQWLYKLRICHENTTSDQLCTFTIRNKPGTWHTYAFQNFSPISSLKGRDEINKMLKSNDDMFEIELCPFLERIYASIETKNWVDIENEYYQCLLEWKNYPIAQLNKDFAFLRDKLIEYLSAIECPDVNPEIKKLIQAPILKDDIAITSLSIWTDFVNERLKYDTHKWNTLLRRYGMELFASGRDFDYAYRAGLPTDQEEYSLEEIDRMSERLNSSPSALIPDRIMLLNFNYTNMADKSLPNDEEFPIVHIHDELTDPDSVIFGYGDEVDEGYEMLKKKNNNEYLEYMKTPRYLEADNYRRMQAFIDSAPYQVFIMGHSCGNSDRTLLQTLFEHKNCVSIKPFYYVDEKGKTDYLDKVQNISRNFTDTTKMRERVVNKRYCEPLPQLKAE